MNNVRRWAAREIKSPLRRYARLCASAYRRRGEVDVASLNQRQRAEVTRVLPEYV